MSRWTTPQWQALDPPQRRQRTLEASSACSCARAKSSRSCVVVEDLHWIDAETQALLDSLVESLPTARLLLLVNLSARVPARLGHQDLLHRSSHRPAASRERAEACSRRCSGRAEPRSRSTALLIERTEGNPFFLEESVRILVETRVLTGERGAYRLAAVRARQVPATVQAVLAARIDRLPTEDKTAAPGRRGHRQGRARRRSCSAIAELPEESVRRDLAHLPGR